AIPEGARIQLDPAFDVDGQPWPAWEKTIARALQTYGAYLEDTGGSLAFYAEPNLDRGYDAWSLAGVPGAPQSLANLPWDSFRVLDRKSTRLNSSHEWISYAVFCLQQKNITSTPT